MNSVREPILDPVAIDDLRPTQITVGLHEVAEKRAQWRVQRGKGGKFLGTHLIPVIRGPKNRPYVVDHHHLARALLEEGVEHVLTITVADLRHLGAREFWSFAEQRAWVHPFDAHGRHQSVKRIPKRIADLVDDPFRSLAGAIRRMGGYAKDVAPFSEFMWADFFRHRLGRRALEKNFAAVERKAFHLARSGEAAHLPGWCGPRTHG